MLKKKECLKIPSLRRHYPDQVAGIISALFAVANLAPREALKRSVL